MLVIHIKTPDVSMPTVFRLLPESADDTVFLDVLERHDLALGGAA